MGLMGNLPWSLPPLMLTAKAFATPSVHVTFPLPHSYWQVSKAHGLLANLPIYFQTNNFDIPMDGFLVITGDNLPTEGYRQTWHQKSFFLSDIDPGTHLWQLELRSWNDSASAMAQATLHVEVVVDLLDERSPWHYTLQNWEKRPRVLVNPELPMQQQLALDARPLDKRLPVCYVSSTSGAYDGQRRMWLQIMEGLRAGDYGNFQFEVKTFERIATNAPVVKALHHLNINLHGLPLEIPREELSEEEASPDGVIRALLASFYRQFPHAKHNSRLVSRLDQPALRQLRPAYAARIWHSLVEALRSPCGDGLIVFSNSRRISDELLVLAARLAGTRALIMELANLHPTRVDVDYLLAPSHFAKEHYSVAKNVRAHSTIVLTTGVNTLRFAPLIRLPPQDKNFIIGYVGRLSSEKSLGILLAAMKILAPMCSHCRLRMVGDGSQKAQLKSLATEWGLLGTSVEFVDGIYNDESALVQTFREMHVFASPMFTETLGLAVLEAMSVGLPVVGFISAGTGEFLENNYNCVAVTKATPAAFADALLTLVNNTTQRLRLGRQARKTVTERFSMHTALEQYGKLYERAGRRFDRTKVQ